MPKQDQSGESPTGLTYFYDFIRIIKTDYPHASLLAILEEVAFVNAVGPTSSGLSRDDNVYSLRIHIGFGHKALIEFEHDNQGRLQPVMGGIIKE